MSSTFPNQIENRNFLSPVGFKFTIAKEPKVGFFCNSATIPRIRTPTVVQPSYLKDLDVPGTKPEYDDLRIRFLVDENMENYMILHNWITGLGFPETTQQYRNLITEDDVQDPKEAYSDGTLYILNSNFNTFRKVIFKDLFPMELTSLEFDATLEDIRYFTAEALFKYTVYNIVDNEGKKL
tara:strand:+ start:29 stop:571 length:543 start_codon:yes stop_codon:yes gene_type:complete